MKLSENDKMKEAVLEALANYINEKESILVDGKEELTIKIAQSNYDKDFGIRLVEPIGKSSSDDYLWYVKSDAKINVGNSLVCHTKMVSIDACCELSWKNKEWTAEIKKCAFHND